METVRLKVNHCSGKPNIPLDGAIIGARYKNCIGLFIPIIKLIMHKSFETPAPTGPRIAGT